MSTNFIQCNECGEPFQTSVSDRGRPLHNKCRPCRDEESQRRLREDEKRQPINALFATVGTNIQALMDLVRSQAYEDGYQQGRKDVQAQAEWLAEYYAATEAHKNDPDF